MSGSTTVCSADAATLTDRPNDAEFVLLSPFGAVPKRSSWGGTPGIGACKEALQSSVVANLPELHHY